MPVAAVVFGGIDLCRVVRMAGRYLGYGTLVVWLCLDNSWSPNTVSPPLCTVRSVVCPLSGVCWLLL